MTPILLDGGMKLSGQIGQMINILYVTLTMTYSLKNPAIDMC